MPPGSQKDDTAPATKKDIAGLMEYMGKLYGRVETFERSMDEKFDSMWDRMKRYLDVKIENLQYDYIGAKSDKASVHDDRIADHEKRIKTIERRVFAV